MTLYPVVFLASLAAVADELASRANLERNIGAAVVGALCHVRTGRRYRALRRSQRWGKEKRDRKSRLQNNSQAVTPKPTEDVGKVELHKENDTLRQLRKYYALGGSGDWFACF